MTLDRRRLLLSGSAALAGGLARRGSGRAQNDEPPGQILFVRDGNIWRWRGGNAREFISGGNLTSPRWSPGAGQILFVRVGESFSDLYVMTLFDRSEARLTFNEPVGYQIGSPDYVKNSVWVVDPSWSAAGPIAYASDYFTPYGVLSLWVMPYAGAAPSLYLNDPATESIDGISISSGGGLVAYTSRDDGLDDGYVSYVATRDLSTWATSVLVQEPEGAYDPAIEPGGTRVAVVIRRGGVSDVWLVDRLGGEPLQVTTGANAARPCWLSDGTWLAWLQLDGFDFEVRAARISGRNIGPVQRIFGYGDIDSTAGLSWTASE